MLHYDHSLTCHLWSLIPTFLLKRPKSGRPRCLAPASWIEAPRHCRSRRPPRHLLTAEAPPPRPGPCAPQSAAAFRLRRFSAAVGFPAKTTAQRPRRRGRTTEVVGILSSTDTTDKRTMNVLDSTSSKMFKAKTLTNTLNKFCNVHISNH